MDKSQSDNNKRKRDRLLALIAKTWGRVLQTGYHGSVSFTAEIQDGDIQGISREENETER